ncbi:phospholipase D-like domain-containing protein [Paenibacillus sp. YPG26]|uniref:phospholipase D-like domain-containing protein n=1 Tax=Paenibacillus sp. YPG26 TaxID=2878915 RepID=UPI00203CCFFF|nr:phospholipase D-like domain-containing protein [Paenibacillus sp. YPG26]USB33058.1 phosphatidylserine/phosphatidylglycerophosphate/cardiolipin synthase family protein [Paenibacillus sp. YPG26]
MKHGGVVSMDQWDQELQDGMINFMNYYLSHGPVEKVIEGAELAKVFADTHISFEAAARYRQELGGFFTSAVQLKGLPGLSIELLEQLAYLVCQLDLGRLSALLPGTTENNKVDAYVNGPDCLQVLLEEINQAERYIHLSVMLFFNDHAGNKVVQALLDARARGVVVRVMVDYGITAVGYNSNLKYGDFGSLAEQLEAAGCQLINTFTTSYNNVDWESKRKELAAAGVPEHGLFLQDYVQEQVTTGLNVINHRKFLVIDGVTSIVGSINVGDQYLFETPVVSEGDPKTRIEGTKLGYPAKEDEWHDGCFRIRGAAAYSLNQIFVFQWTVLGGDVFDPADDFYYPEMDRRFGEEQCTLFASFPGNPVNLIQQYYLDLLKYAGDETIIVNPYLIDNAFWETLESLEEEQARHIIICNPLNVNDHPTNKAAVQSHMYAPFHKGVSYYDYSKTGRFSHWKITYDARAHCVFHGSYNINERSACHDFELGILVKSASFADKVRGIIGYDLSVSEQVADDKAFFKHPYLHPSTYFNKITEYFT